MTHRQEGKTAKNPLHLHTYLAGEEKSLKLLSFTDLPELGDVTGQDEGAALFLNEETGEYVEGTVSLGADAKDAVEEATGEHDHDGIVVKLTPVEGTHIPVLSVAQEAEQE